MAETIDRELNVNVSLPESALKALRNIVAVTVADGINDGFKQFEKLHADRSKKTSGKEKTDKTDLKSDGIKEFGDSIKKTTKESNSLMNGFKSLGKVIALVIAAMELLDKMMKSVEQMSTQIISQQTLFTDKNIMGLMQQTGQTATEATATDRALRQLGITLEDIQSGLVTEAQMSEFENLRGIYVESLTGANKNTAAMFQAWQEFTIQVGVIGNTLSDMFVGLLGSSGAVENLTEQLQPLAAAIEHLLSAIMPLVPIILDLVAEILPAATILIDLAANILPPVLEVVNLFVTAIKEILPGLMPIIDAVARIISALLSMSAATEPATKVLNFFVDAINALIKPVADFVTFVADVVETLTFGKVKLTPFSGSGITSQTNNNLNTSSTQYINNYNQTNSNLFSNDYVGAN